jgi:predicted SAM-dependent methyltransferase
MTLTWSTAQHKSPLYLNLGGKGDCHPKENYSHYISVDLQGEGDFCICHDLTQSIPLEDGIVDRIHTEDALHYLEKKDAQAVLSECHRLLQKGGRLRISLPDYNHPKDRPYLKAGTDPRHPRHLWLSTYDVLKEMIEKSPFNRYTFYHYWDGDQFVKKDIDYTGGMIRRTPDKDPRCRKKYTMKTWGWNLRYLIRKQFRISPLEYSTLRGKPLHITSLVVDCLKD